MLPVVICEPDGSARAQWMNILSSLLRTEFPSVRPEIMPGEEHELRRIIETESGIVLVVMGVQGDKEGEIERCIKLFSDVMERNRDNYVVLCVHGSCLGAVLSQCMRPAGVLVIPYQEDIMRVTLRRILNDYLSMHDEADEADYMMVSAGKGQRRIAYRDILYLEAQDKLLNINTEHFSLSVRGSLNALAGTLPEDFIRCHRAYIVNRSYIERLDLPGMELQLTTQERLPISRSYKEALRESLRAEGWT